MLTYNTPEVAKLFQTWIDTIKEISTTKKLTNEEIIELVDNHSDEELQEAFRRYRKLNTFELVTFSQWLLKSNGIEKRSRSPFSIMSDTLEDIPAGTWQHYCDQWRRRRNQLYGKDQTLTIDDLYQYAFIEAIRDTHLQGLLRNLDPQPTTVAELAAQAESLAERYKIPVERLNRAVAKRHQLFPIKEGTKNTVNSDRGRKRFKTNTYASEHEGEDTSETARTSTVEAEQPSQHELESTTYSG